jgi:ABC-2 type transport system ATP-binding protein
MTHMDASVISIGSVVKRYGAVRALDAQGGTEFWRSMRAYSQTGRTLVFATHYLDEVDDNASRVVVLVGGAVVADGTANSIRRLAGTSTVRFSVPEDASIAGDALAALPGVTQVVTRTGRVTLSTAEPDATVRALAHSSLPWWDLVVSPASLDESFLKLTEASS